MPETRKTQRRLAQAVLLLIAGLLVVVLFGPQIFGDRRRDDIASCRSEYNSAKDVAGDVVDQAQDAIDEAQRPIDDVRSELSKMVLRGLAATAVGDQAALSELAFRTPIMVAALDELEARMPPLLNAKADAREIESKAVKRYFEQSKLASTNPDRFLDECKRTRR